MSENQGISRRGLLAGGLGVLAGGAALGAGVTRAARDDTASPAARTPNSFVGLHQPGITTPAQDRLHFASFDVTTRSRQDLVDLLRSWTIAGERMMRGEPAGTIGPTSGPYDAPPDDTGEAIGLPAAGLSLTIGFGPSLFDGRFGLAGRRPGPLTRLPHFPFDNLDPERSDGDICVQACADDPQIAVHAIRNLARIGFGTVSVRWSQLGFGRTSSTSTAQQTPRNLFGFKDGTANVMAEETEALDQHIWVGDDVPARAGWLRGGSYLVSRRIVMNIETWDRQTLRDQENIFGRSKAEGAPLSGGEEFSEPDFAMKGRSGPLIDPNSHVHLAHPTTNDGSRMLRRGYNFVDGTTELGRLNAGLFFIAFVRDPNTHYIPVQNRLASNDLLSEYLQHTASGLFAVPPGVRDGEFVGQALFA